MAATPASVRLLLVAALLFYLTLTYQQNFRLGRAPAMLICWLASLTALLTYYRQLDRERAITTSAQLKWSQTDSWATVILMGLALAPRVLWLDHFPLAMHNDAAALSYDAVKVLDTRIHNPFALGWYSHPTLWAYLNSLPIRVMGNSIFAARLVAALIGTLTVGSTYLLVRTLFGRPTALICAALLASFHLHIHFSRIALNNIADPLFGTLILTALAMALHTRRQLYFALTGIGAGLALYFYHGARLFVPLSLLLAVLWLFRHRARGQPWWHLDPWLSITPFVAGVLFTAGPLMYIFIKRPQAFLLRFAKEGLSETVLTQLSVSSGKGTGAILLDHLWQALLFFPLHVDTNFDFYDRERTILWGLAAGLMLLGLLIALLHIRQWRFQLPLAWYGMTAIFAGMLMDYPIKTPRFITLAPVVCLFIAIAIWTIAVLVQRIHVRLRAAGIILAACTVLYISGSHLHAYFVEYRARETYGNFSSEAATMLSRQLFDAPQGSELWFLGNRWVSYDGFPIFHYLLPQVIGEDVRQTVVGTHHVPTASANTPSFYASVPEREGELQIVADRYPEGTWSRIEWPHRAEVLLVVYRIDPR